MPIDLSIVIPAWNEAARLPSSLEQLRAFREGLALDVEILLVVEPSADATLEIAQAFAARAPYFQVIANPVHGGKGFATRTGMLRAQGDYVFYMDADLSVPLGEMLGFLEEFKARPELHVLVGNRAHAQSRITRRQTLLRQRMGQLFNRVLQGLALVSLADTQCGFKAFRREAAREIFSRQTLDGFAFDVEVLLLAQGLGYPVADLPVEWINAPESKVNILADSVRMLLDSARLRRRVEKALAEKPLFRNYEG